MVSETYFFINGIIMEFLIIYPFLDWSSIISLVKYVQESHCMLNTLIFIKSTQDWYSDVRLNILSYLEKLLFGNK